MALLSNTNFSHAVQSGRKKLALFLVVPAVLCIGGSLTLVARMHTTRALAAETKAASAEPVAIFHATQGDATEDLVLPAQLQAYDESPVYARVNGYVAKWFTDIGTHVRAGQLLAVIDSPQVDQQLVQARASVNQAKANLSLANVTTKRYQDLIGSNSVSQQELDNNLQNQAVQNASLQSATAQVAWLEQEQSYEKIVAPFDGVITERRTDIGDLVNAGNGGAGTEMFSVSRISTMRIFVAVPEAYSEQIRDRMSVKIELTALPGQFFSGTVTRTDNAINPQSRTLLVEVDVPNPSGKLMPGAYAQVHFALPSPVRPLTVPSGTILFQAAGPQVAVVNSRNQIELRKVGLGRDLGGTMEITSGISAQDEIVANPPDFLVDGMPASIQHAN
ncbi:MAG TPA: efflux RND transporter periplasmic adaptor subunit [Acidobacteriaceae bacterium]|jgi:RND family efflux transporter MFP subunit|nr:efflux RND transporter periplasmic adaptor subunit [Acidobacteriaceae bacterium]